MLPFCYDFELFLHFLTYRQRINPENAHLKSYNRSVFHCQQYKYRRLTEWFIALFYEEIYEYVLAGGNEQRTETVYKANANLLISALAV